MPFVKEAQNLGSSGKYTTTEASQAWTSPSKAAAGEHSRLNVTNACSRPATSSHWRTGAGAHRAGSYVSTYLGSTATHRTRRDLGEIDSDPESYRIGEVVQVAHIVPTLDPNEKNDDHKIPTNTVGNVCPKYRWAVVIGIFEDKLVVLPVYSCHSNGIKNKSRAYQRHAMSLVLQGEYDVETLNKVTTEPLYLTGQWKPTSGAHININEPYTVSYSWRIKRIRSYLEPTSAMLLQTRYRLAVGMGATPVAKQETYFLSRTAAEKQSTGHPQSSRTEGRDLNLKMSHMSVAGSSATNRTWASAIKADAPRR